MHSPADAAYPPLLVVISGPSGVGKDALLQCVRDLGAPFITPVTMTTRPIRPGEVDGRDYLFVSRERFEADLAAGELLEHAEVYGNWYGVPRSQLREAFASGRDVMMRVDVQGAATLRDLVPGALFIFLAPESPERLAEHLQEREYEDEAVLARRLAAAERELGRAGEFDHTVVNVEGDLEGTARRLLELVSGERARPGRTAPSV